MQIRLKADATHNGKRYKKGDTINMTLAEGEKFLKKVNALKVKVQEDEPHQISEPFIKED